MPPDNLPLIADNLSRIRERIAQAAERCGRSSDEITLVAVTKTQPAESLQAVLDAGATDIGENYVAEAEAKFREVDFPEGVTRHCIGHLQSNKARRALDTFDVIQSVDSIKLLTRLDTAAAERATMVSVLLEVRLTDEPEKTGFLPDELPTALETAARAPHIRVLGLMGMAPFTPDMERRRATFRELYCHYLTLEPSQRHILSMGMTDDFEIAIEEGSTMVRIGTALFGPRT
ncbi:MAG TPA: YggS family pyridoxal phosphate-dependent enzyme [Armatimonadota bacterium]|nr:YggS family pyridoxal phosphate-dependent enzyme [Armatimonadota bacterium]